MRFVLSNEHKYQQASGMDFAEAVKKAGQLYFKGADGKPFRRTVRDVLSVSFDGRNAYTASAKCSDGLVHEVKGRLAWDSFDRETVDAMAPLDDAGKHEFAAGFKAEFVGYIIDTSVTPERSLGASHGRREAAYRR